VSPRGSGLSVLARVVEPRNQTTSQGQVGGFQDPVNPALDLVVEIKAFQTSEL